MSVCLTQVRAAIINATGWRLDLHHQINHTGTRPSRQPPTIPPRPNHHSQPVPAHAVRDAPPSLPRSPIIFSYKSHWMAHWFYPAALSVGRGAGATVIAFNIINIISHIIWGRDGRYQEKRVGWMGTCPPSWLLNSLLSLPAHANTHTHTPRPQPNNLLSSDNSNFPCHTWRAKSPNLLHSFWLASFF